MKKWNTLNYTKSILMEATAILALSGMSDDMFPTYSYDNLLTYYKTVKGLPNKSVTLIKALIPFHNGDHRLIEFYNTLEEPIKSYFEDGLIMYYGKELAIKLFKFEY